jgi:hypothetical protein
MDHIKIIAPAQQPCPSKPERQEEISHNHYGQEHEEFEGVEGH